MVAVFAKMFLVIVFFSLFNFCLNYETKICGVDKNVNLVKSVNDDIPNLIFIQSPGYPRSMTKEEIENCQFNFIKDENDTTLKFVITNGNVKNINTIGTLKYNATGHYYFEAASLETRLTMFYTNTSLSTNSWHAFQGYVLSESLETCHSNADAIKFENESQIIYLRPHNIRNDTNFKCNWAFVGPKEYGFKFVIKEAHNDLNLSVITSSGYDVIKGYGIQENQAYYNPDNFLNISVEGKKQFEGYVTFVKNHYTVENATCNLIKNGTTLIWTNIQDTSYPTNAQCVKSLEIPDNSFVTLKIAKFEAEPFVDYIEIIDAYDKKHYINHHNLTSWPLNYTPAFFSTRNKRDNKLTLHFVSDGSVQNEGFELLFQIFDCKCSSEIITVPCNGKQKYSILEQTSEYICPNTICHLNPECSMKHVVLTFDHAVIMEEKSIGFKIYTENETYVKSETFTSLYHQTLSIPFKPNSILSFFSLKNDSYAVGRSLDFILMTIDVPNVWRNSVISVNTPSIQTDLLTMPKNSIYIVELSEDLISKGDSIEMLTAQFIHLSCILLFNNKNLQKIDNSLIKMLESENQISSNSSIAIYKSLHCKDIKMPVLYKAKKVITEISKYSGTCEIVLLSHKPYQIKKQWTTKEGDVIKRSKSSNQMEQKQLSTFLIPPNSSIYLITSFSTKETINFYKLPSKNRFDIKITECDKRKCESEKSNTFDKIFDEKCKFQDYEIGFEDSLYALEFIDKTKISEDNDDLYTMLQNAGFNIFLNDTHDKWGNPLPKKVCNEN